MRNPFKKRNAIGKKIWNYLKSWIPQKSDSHKIILRKSICLVSLCIFLVSSALLVYHLIILPTQTDIGTKAIQDIYYHRTDDTQIGSDTSSSSAPERDENGKLIQFVNLQKINSDIKAWIKIPNTIIDYPVLQSDKKDPEFYLRRDYNKKGTKYGSIFLDARCSFSPVQKIHSNWILYGHSMQDGRMFAPLIRFGELDQYRNSPILFFDTDTEQSTWKILSVFKTNTYYNQGEPFDYIQTEFQNDSDYLNFVYQAKIRSIINIPVDFQPSDQILTLSTCSYEFDGFRTVILARRVRDGESTQVNTEKAVFNPNVLYPDCWYKKHGGKAPVWPKTYEDAKKQNLFSFEP